jgi:tetratricopeptide (TPR) repeat protein
MQSAALALRRVAGPLLAVAALALLVRFAHLAELRMHADAAVPLAATRSAQASDRPGGPAAADRTAFAEPPLYDHVLAAFVALGSGPLAPRAIQFLLGVATALLTAHLAGRLIGRRAAMLAGIAAALYGPFVLFEGRLLAPSLVVFLSTAGLALLETGRARAALLPRIAAGSCFGLAALARPEVLLVAAVLGCGLFWVERAAARAPGRGPARAGSHVPGRPALRLAAFLGMALLVTFTATARNWIVAREVVWVSSDGGLRLFLGNNPRSDQILAGDPERVARDLALAAQRETGLSVPAAYSRYFYAQVRGFIRAEPEAYARLLGVKTARFLAGYEVGRDEDFYVSRAWSRLLTRLVWQAGPFGFPFGLVSPLAVLGAILLWPRRRDLALIYLSASAFAMVTIAYFVTAATRLPAVPPLLVLAAGAVDWMLERRQAPGLALRFGAAAAALLLVFHLNPAAPHGGPPSETHRARAAAEYERQHYALAVAEQARAIGLDPARAELHFDQGLYLTAAGDTAGAIAAYQRAIELAPGYGEPKVNLANLLVRAGDFPTAVRLYIEAAVGDPDLLPAHVAVGSAFLHSGHPDSALARFEHVLARDPAHTEATLGRIAALSDLGRGAEAVAAARAAIATFGETPALLAAQGQALRMAGRTTEAIAALKAALALDPERADTWVTLGQCYRTRGQLAAAEEAQKRAIALAPTLVPARVNLADVYARRGLLDQALRELERALELDPFNETAIYNMAAVQAQLGEEAVARAMLERLLAVNPQHAPARSALAHLAGHAGTDPAAAGTAHSR